MQISDLTTPSADAAKHGRAAAAAIVPRGGPGHRRFARGSSGQSARS